MSGIWKRSLLLVGILTVINAALYLNKEPFNYKPYSTESSLYAPATAESFRFFTDFPREGREQAIRFLDSVLPISDTARVSEIKEIASFLYVQFYSQLGKPAAVKAYRDPWEMYRYYSADSSRKLWCGHLAILFNYFCLARGIETRMIEIMKPGDHHVVNECYLPDSRQWVLVDITYNQLLVSTVQGKLFGLAEFRRLHGQQDLVQVQTAGDSNRLLMMDTGYILNYYQPDLPAHYYKTVNPDVVYSNTEKVRRYILPVSWYSILVKDRSANTGFYFRQAFLIAWLLSLVYLLFLVIKKSSQGRIIKAVKNDG